MIWADTGLCRCLHNDLCIGAAVTCRFCLRHKGPLQNCFHTSLILYALLIRQALKCKNIIFIQVCTWVHIISNQFIRCRKPCLSIEGTPCVRCNVIADCRRSPVIMRIRACSIDQILDLPGFGYLISYKCIPIHSGLNRPKFPVWVFLMDGTQIRLIAVREPLRRKLCLKISIPTRCRRCRCYTSHHVLGTHISGIAAPIIGERYLIPAGIGCILYRQCLSTI